MLLCQQVSFCALAQADALAKACESKMGPHFYISSLIRFTCFYAFDLWARH